jgi:hypothetical protein
MASRFFRPQSILPWWTPSEDIIAMEEVVRASSGVGCTRRNRAVAKDAMKGKGIEDSEASPAKRFWPLAALFFLCATLAMTWPMASRLSDHYSARQDFYLNTWNLWWVAKALTEKGAELWRTELLFHPLGAQLQSQPFSLLQTVPAVPFTLAFGPVVVFNALVLLGFWFGGFAAALWMHALTRDAAASLLGGALFTFAPYHYTYLAELNVVATGWMPLYLLAATALWRRPGAGRAALAGAALGAVGLSCWYYGVATGLLALALSAARLRRAGRDGVRGAAAIELAHWAACAALIAPVAMRMAPAFAALSSEEETEKLGMGLLMERFKGTEVAVGLWSYAGFCTLALAFCAPRRHRSALWLMAAVFAILSLGARADLFGASIPLPYAWLQAIPLANAVRYPDRFFALAQLALAALAACSAAELRRRIHLRLLVPGLIALALLELTPGRLTNARDVEALPVPERSDADAGALLHAPVTFFLGDGEQLYHQIRHGRPIAGGYVTRPDPPSVARQRSDPAIGPFALPKAVPLGAELPDELRELGFGYICVQREPLVEGAGKERRTFFGPFSATGKAFLSQRLFPTYPVHERMRANAVHWEQDLERLLGAPLAQTKKAAVYRIP